MNRYERLNQERKIGKRKWLHIAVFQPTMKTKRIPLKASSDILSSILNVILIGSFMRYLLMCRTVD